MLFNQRFVENALSEVQFIHNNFPEEVSFSVDTRTLKPGDIFIALPGVHVDGHRFLAQAIERGAAGAIIAESQCALLDVFPNAKLKELLIIAVPDTLKALVALAKAWRAQFVGPVVGITGSVGKTSTKEYVAHILRMQNVAYVASEGNQNTLIGVSLNLLRIKDFHTVAIIEMGISKRGEMALLVDVVRPTNALITIIGHQHMDGLGSLNDIALEKREIFKYFTEESIGIINGDQAILSDVSYSHPVIRIGCKTTNQIQARKIRMINSSVQFVLKMYGKKYAIVIPKPHTGAVANALAAAAIARLLHVPDEIIVHAIQQPLVIAERFEKKQIKAGRGVMISDCYNANPESMKAALLAFQQIDTESYKVAVLGDMLGLGVNSPFWHRQIGRFLRKIPSLNKVILVGSLVQWTKKTAPVNVSVDLVATWQEAAHKLTAETPEAVLVLVKGSKDIGLAHLVEQFTE